jgi:GDP-L-fucose synthase
MDKDLSVFVAGHNGLVGSAMVRRLLAQGYRAPLLRSRSELDLTNQAAVARFFETERPDVVLLAAAKVGGIQANNLQRADFIYQNLMIEANVIHAAHRTGVQRLVFLGSNCIYPKVSPQPVKEEYLLTGPLEPTNEPYAIAKIAGVKLCESFNRQYGTRYLTAMPANMYGPGDNYDLATCHVLPALIRKVHEAKVRSDGEMVVWGTGKPRREFMYADDLADACIFLSCLDDDAIDTLLAEPAGPLVNVGTGHDQTILSIAERICEVVGFGGRIVNDLSKPDGTHQKLLDTARLDRLGWRPSVSLDDGLNRTYEAFCEVDRSSERRRL